MTMTHVTAFAITFVAGPLLCAALLRLPPRLWSVGALSLAMAAVITWALQLRLAADGPAWLSLAALWLAWVLAVSMVGLALRRRLTQPRSRRWITFTALLATTLPWFGLATALSLE